MHGEAFYPQEGMLFGFQRLDEFLPVNKLRAAIVAVITRHPSHCGEHQ